MVSVRDSVSACQMGCLRTEFRLNALPQASVALSHALSGPDLSVVVLVALALAAAVVLTAIWSPDRERRKAARDVLDRLTRWRG
jgi:hypothetical protein